VKLDIVLEEVLPHPVEAVWGALIDRTAISEWLMHAPEFEPVVGARFRLKTEALAADGWVKAEVAELDPPRRMVWSGWLDDATPTTVTFDLAAEAGGTRLTVSHAGDIDPIAGGLVRSGWPGKIERLRRTLERA
jgi:uncharacterized protein YndB with AHSA1/START domain